MKNIENKIKRGEKAFNAYINEEDLNTIALFYSVPLKILVEDMIYYQKRILDPKPTPQELNKYYEIKNKKRQEVLIDRKEIIKEQKTEMTPKIIAEKEAFNAFITSDKNQSAVVNLALKHGVDPETIRNNAFNYTKRTDEFGPTKEELAIFKAVNISRKETYHRDRIDFTDLDDFINLESNLVNDYIDLIIESHLSFNSIIDKINLYIKYNSEETKNNKKLNSIKVKALKYEKYILSERKNRSKKQLSDVEVQNNLDKTAQIIEDYIIDNSQKLSRLLFQHELTERAFNKNLELLKDGTDKEKILYQEYNKILEEEKQKIAEDIKIIYHHLENGKLDSGFESKFNIIDFYRITNLKPEIFLSKVWKYAKDNLYTKGEIQRVSDAINTFTRNDVYHTEEELIKLNFSYNNMTIEDINIKIKLIEELKRMGIPLTTNTYITLAEEYLNGLINLNNKTLE